MHPEGIITCKKSLPNGISILFIIFKILPARSLSRSDLVDRQADQISQILGLLFMNLYFPTRRRSFT